MPMPPLVLGLQMDAQDPNVRVSDLLRKALAVARKLKLAEFAKWIERELEGYAGVPDDQIPRYRRIRGELEGWNPYHGWVPVFLGEDLEEAVSVQFTRQSISELEDMVTRSRPGAIYQFVMPTRVKEALGRAVGFSTDFRVSLNRSSLVAILEAVRNTILQWTLDLEERGILGGETRFTEEEVKRAEHTREVHQYFFGPVGQIQQDTIGSVQMQQYQELDVDVIRQVVEQLRAVVSELSGEERAIADAHLVTIDAQLKSPRPDRSILRNALTALRRVAEQALGSALGSAILAQLNQVLGGL